VSRIDFNRLNGPQRGILRDVLASVFRRTTLDMFLVESGYEPLEDIVPPGTFQYQLFELIGELRRRGWLNDLLQTVRRKYPDSPDLLDLEQRLRFADDEAASQRVLGTMGLERMVRNAGFDNLNLWARRLVEIGRRVCQIEYDVQDGSFQGSGFLVLADLVLTNYHVIEPLLDGQAGPDAVRVRFDHAETGTGPAAAESRSLADDWLLAKSPYGAADLQPDAGMPTDDELDFALLRLEPGTSGTAAGAQRGAIDLASLAGPRRSDAVVFVLQHPKGAPLKQSIGVLRPQVTPLRLRYDADTDHGSSGGLVLDQQLAPLALHHAGDPSAKLQAEYNQGIPLALIRAALESDPAVPRFWSS